MFCSWGQKVAGIWSVKCRMSESLTLLEEEDINGCIKFQGNPSSGCWDISVWTNTAFNRALPPAELQTYNRQMGIYMLNKIHLLLPGLCFLLCVTQERHGALRRREKTYLSSKQRRREGGRGWDVFLAANVGIKIWQTLNSSQCDIPTERRALIVPEPSCRGSWKALGNLGSCHRTRTVSEPRQRAINC